MATNSTDLASLQAALSDDINTLIQVQIMTTNFQKQAAVVKEGTHAAQEIDYTA